MTDYKKEAKERLKKVSLKGPWKNPRGEKRYDLVTDDEIIGHINKKVDLSKLTMGDVHKTPRGNKVELMYEDEGIGFLWVE